jgi:hypothetical protein
MLKKCGHILVVTASVWLSPIGQAMTDEPNTGPLSQQALQSHIEVEAKRSLTKAQYQTLSQHSVATYGRPVAKTNKDTYVLFPWLTDRGGRFRTRGTECQLKTPCPANSETPPGIAMSLEIEGVEAVISALCMIFQEELGHRGVQMADQDIQIIIGSVFQVLTSKQEATVADVAKEAYRQLSSRYSLTEVVPLIRNVIGGDRVDTIAYVTARRVWKVVGFDEQSPEAEVALDEMKVGEKKFYEVEVEYLPGEHADTYGKAWGVVHRIYSAFGLPPLVASPCKLKLALSQKRNPLVYSFGSKPVSKPVWERLIQLSESH